MFLAFMAFIFLNCINSSRYLLLHYKPPHWLQTAAVIDFAHESAVRPGHVWMCLLCSMCVEGSSAGLEIYLRLLTHIAGKWCCHLGAQLGVTGPVALDPLCLDLFTSWAFLRACWLLPRQNFQDRVWKLESLRAWDNVTSWLKGREHGPHCLKGGKSKNVWLSLTFHNNLCS